MCVVKVFALLLRPLRKVMKYKGARGGIPRNVEREPMQRGA